MSVIDEIAAERRRQIEVEGWTSERDDREAWAKVGDEPDDIHACPDLRVWAYYRADAVDPERQRWRSPIHMPRKFSRLTLTVTDVRVQRLQDISEADAIAEGWPAPEDRAAAGVAEIRDAYPIGWYAALWDRLHGPGSWDANPWVTATSFIAERRNIDGGG